MTAAALILLCVPSGVFVLAAIVEAVFGPLIDRLVEWLS